MGNDQKSGLGLNVEPLDCGLECMRKIPLKQGVAGYVDGDARAQQSLKHLFVTMPFHFKNGSGEEGGLLARSPKYCQQRVHRLGPP